MKEGHRFEMRGDRGPWRCAPAMRCAQHLLAACALIVWALAPMTGEVRGSGTGTVPPVAGPAPAVQASGGGLQGQYFADRALREPRLTRLDPTIDFDWGTSPPDANVPKDAFSVRWRGEVWIDDGGVSTFITIGNDGVRLWVDGRRVIDNWTTHAATEDSGQIRLDGGRWYPITLEYFDDTRDAQIVLAHESKSTPREVIPPDRLRPPVAPSRPPIPGGLRGEYFDDQKLTDLAVVRIDRSIAFDWGDGSPDPLLAADGFSVRWEGEIRADADGVHEFVVTGDDGVRLWLDGGLVIDDWNVYGVTENAGGAELSGDRWHAFRLEYFDDSGAAQIRVAYAPPGGEPRSIPPDRLRPAVGGPVAASTSAGSVVADPATPAAPPVAAVGDTGCATTIQALVDAAAPGDVVAVPPCVYRETVSVTKPLTLDGQGQAEIRGSDVWSTGWIRRGDRWVHTGAPGLPNPYGSCRQKTERCHWPHQVFLDGVPLLQVASDPSPGEFAVENETIVLADEPAGRTIEVTARTQWILAGTSNVTIQGFAMRHAGNPSQSGAINVDGFSNWTVRDSTLVDAHGVVVVFTNGSGFALEDNELARGGSVGVGIGDSSAVVLRGNRIHHNNTEGFDPGWSAGGLKAVRVEQMVIEKNDVFANDGPGLWCDVDCINVTIRNNRVHHNWSQGIQYEISRDARIYENAVWENGWGRNEWCFGAGILVQNSSHVEVYRNVLAWNANGITVISQDRGADRNRVIETFVHDNVIASSGEGTEAHTYCEDWAGGVLFDRASNNRGAGNRYWFPDPEGTYGRFGWGGRAIDHLAEFAAVSGSRHGWYISDAETDSKLSNAGIPLQPESRSQCSPRFSDQCLSIQSQSKGKPRGPESSGVNANAF